MKPQTQTINPHFDFSLSPEASFEKLFKKSKDVSKYAKTEALIKDYYDKRKRFEKNQEIIKAENFRQMVYAICNKLNITVTEHYKKDKQETEFVFNLLNSNKFSLSSKNLTPSEFIDALKNKINHTKQETKNNKNSSQIHQGEESLKQQKQLLKEVKYFSKKQEQIRSLSTSKVKEQDLIQQPKNQILQTFTQEELLSKVEELRKKREKEIERKKQLKKVKEKIKKLEKSQNKILRPRKIRRQKSKAQVEDRVKVR